VNDIGTWQFLRGPFSRRRRFTPMTLPMVAAMLYSVGEIAQINSSKKIGHTKRKWKSKWKKWQARPERNRRGRKSHVTFPLVTAW